MNIVLFTDTYPPEINGVATSTFALRNTLVNHGHKVLVVCTNDSKNEFRIDENYILRIPGIELKKIYGYRMSWVYNSEAMKHIRLFKPDLIHIQTEFGIGQFGFNAARQLKCPTVYTYHTMYEEYAYYLTHGHFDQLIRKFMRTYTKNSMENRVDHVIIPSIKTKDYIRNIGIDCYINVIPTGIDFSIFKRENFDNEKILEEKKKLGIEEDDFVLLSLGRVAKEKSIDVCMKGYAKFVEENRNIKSKFLIVGGGPAIDELRNLAYELGISDRVIFKGPVPNKDTGFYYQLGDVFVTASITETQGLTIMESMASKQLVLARFDSNLVGVIENNKSGIFFTDENELAKKILSIVKMKPEEKEKIIANAYNHIDGYSIERFYENIIGVYNSAIRKNW